MYDVVAFFITYIRNITPNILFKTRKITDINSKGMGAKLEEHERQSRSMPLDEEYLDYLFESETYVPLFLSHARFISSSTSSASSFGLSSFDGKKF